MKRMNQHTEAFYQTCLSYLLHNELDSDTFDACHLALITDGRRYSADNLQDRYLEMVGFGDWRWENSKGPAHDVGLADKWRSSLSLPMPWDWILIEA